MRENHRNKIVKITDIEIRERREFSEAFCDVIGKLISHMPYVNTAFKEGDWEWAISELEGIVERIQVFEGCVRTRAQREMEKKWKRRNGKVIPIR